MQWFKHDSDANLDAKLQNVLLDYGLEGYGLYWYCIELITGKINADNITFSLEHDARIIARNTGSTPEKVSKMMQYFVELGLFENSNGVITCIKLAKRLDQSQTSNPKMRKMIQEIKQNHDGVMMESCKNRIDKNRIDKNKKPKTKRFVPPTLQQVIDYAIIRNQSDELAKKFFDYYDAGNWRDAKGNQVKNWKQKFITWENKNQSSSQQQKTDDFDWGNCI